MASHDRQAPAAASQRGPTPLGPTPLGGGEDRAAELAGRAESLLEQVESLADPAARAAAVELVRSLLELYGEGLARVVGVAVGSGGDAVRAELAGDPLVSQLLLLHGLHPVDAGTRVRQAIEAVRPRLGGAQPELVSLADGAVRLRLPSAGGCRSAAAAARGALAQAVREAAPDIEHVEIDEPAPPPVVIPLESVRSPA